MLLGLQVPSFTWPGAPESTGSTFRRIAADADRAGLASLWVMDHFFQIRGIGTAESDMLEGYSALSFAAAATERIRLGTLVTGVTYRLPAVLIKTVTTLDVLSGGRAYFGVGAAWNEQEHVGLGVPFPPVKERFERLTETLQLAHQMWRDDDSAFDGKHYQLDRPLNHPQPVSTPHPRIMIGGGGERKTLRLVAQYADACNIFEMALPDIEHKLDVLRGHCTDVGRDYTEIEKTTLGSLRFVALPGGDAPTGDTWQTRGSGVTVDQAVQRFEKLAAIGIQHAIVNLPQVHEPGVFDLLAELVPRVAEIEPAA